MRFVTPLKKARGLGAAKVGLHHWWMQRVTAVALLPLTLWAVFSVASLVGQDYAAVAAWFAKPFTSLMLTLWVSATTYHASLGLQVVIEDYVHHPPTKLAALVAAKLLLVLLGTFSVVSILRMAFAG